MTGPDAIVVYQHSGADNCRARLLARQLQIPLCHADDEQLQRCAFYLCYESAGLTLVANQSKTPNSLRLDFADDDLRRRAGDKLRQQNLCRAVGIKARAELSVLDAMAGMGKDAWLLASAGARVDLIERNPVVFALLQDACEREQGFAQLHASNARAGTSAITRMCLHQGEFLDIAGSLSAFDVVYLDPMFPATSKNARAKKDMQLLQSFLSSGDDRQLPNEMKVLTAARRLARNRVVVKRARLSSFLANQPPDAQYKGSSNRFDVYFSGAKATGA